MRASVICAGKRRFRASIPFPRPLGLAVYVCRHRDHFCFCIGELLISERYCRRVGAHARFVAGRLLCHFARDRCALRFYRLHVAAMTALKRRRRRRVAVPTPSRFTVIVRQCRDLFDDHISVLTGIPSFAGNIARRRRDGTRQSFINTSMEGDLFYEINAQRRYSITYDIISMDIRRHDLTAFHGGQFSADGAPFHIGDSNRFRICIGRICKRRDSHFRAQFNVTDRLCVRKRRDLLALQIEIRLVFDRFFRNRYGIGLFSRFTDIIQHKLSISRHLYRDRIAVFKGKFGQVVIFSARAVHIRAGNICCGVVAERRKNMPVSVIF